MRSVKIATKTMLMAGVVWLGLTIFFGSARTEEPDVKKLLSEYVRAVIAEDYERAGAFWHPQYLETCFRLGIVYRDVPFKYDCLSPLFQNIDRIRTGEAAWTTVSTGIDPAHYKVILRIHLPDSTISQDYFFQNSSTGTYLVPRFWLRLNNLNLVKTRYFDLFYRNRSQLNDFALFDLDRFTEKTLLDLGASEEALKALEQQRMEYFLADSDNEVAEFLGARTRAGYYIPSDAIFSRYLPDYHELTLFALSYTQNDLGLRTEPFLQRGLACMFGGRFGQAKEVMPQIANLTLQHDIFRLEDVLTMDGFHAKIDNIDFSYPLSLGLVESLARRYNISSVLKLLTELSGSLDEVAGRSADDVKAALTEFTGKTWEEIEQYAREDLASDPFPNLKRGGISGSGLTVFESGTADYNIKVVLDHGWYNVLLTPHNSGTVIEGTVTMGGSAGHSYNEYKSFLWNEQFPEVPYINQLYSMQYNRDEIGIYDYLTNRLIAKYVVSFDEAGKPSADGGVSFRFKESLLLERMDSYRCSILGAFRDR